MLIIFGTRARQSEVGSGEFTCPRCGAKRQYVRKKVNRVFTLYFIPLFPMGTLGEFVECQTCHTTFKPEVIHMKIQQAPPMKAENVLATLMNNAQKRLEEGMPIDFLVRDLTQAGMELDMARKVVDAAISGDRKRCMACGLEYAVSVSTCRECSETL